MKTARALLVALLLAAAALPVAAQPSTKLPVFINAQTPDPVGQRVAFLLRERLRRSAGFELVPTVERSAMTLSVVSMESQVGNHGLESAYSVVVTATDAAALTGASYWTNMVGMCGASKVAECAETVASLLDRSSIALQAEVQRLRQRQAQPIKPL
jgi:hypothetical protein